MAGRPGQTARLLGVALDVVLVALIVAGVVFRFSWTNWSEGTNLHPDEYGLTGTLTQMRLPDSLGDYFNTRLSPISPYDKYGLSGVKTENGPDNRMRWGQWPIILLRAAAEATGNTGYDELRLMGRRISALADTFALVVIYFIGRRLYGHRAGLLAAALSALAVMQIQQSHFMTADNFGTLFTALAMWAAVEAACGRADDRRPATDDRGSGQGLGVSDQAGDPAALTQPAASTLPDVHTSTPPHSHTPTPAPSAARTYIPYALFGVFFGMAMASRINLLPLAGMIGVAAVVTYAREWGRRDGAAIVTDALLRLAVAGVVSLLTFRVTQPMTFRAAQGDTTIFTLRPNPDWLDSMSVAQIESSGDVISPPGEQWTNRLALVFPWVNMVVWGMGLPLGLTAWAALAWAGWLSLRPGDLTSWRKHALPVVWAAGYFLFMGTRWVKSVRYFLPIYPFLALLAAWAIVELWRIGQRRAAARQNNGHADAGAAASAMPLPISFRSPVALFSVALGAVVLGGTLAWAWGFTNIYRQTNTRLQATRWIYQNMPAPLNLKIETGTTAGLYSEPIGVPFGTAISSVPYSVGFKAPVTGTVTGLTVAYARNLSVGVPEARLHAMLALDPGGTQPLAQGDLVVMAGGAGATPADPRGEPLAIEFGPAALEQGRTYYLVLSTLGGGPVELHGTTFSNENWDEILPMHFDGRNPWGGLYNNLTMESHWPDSPDKRQMYLTNLEAVDYIILPSQRRLWSSHRLPNTYPMTMAYYRALFDGRLGFDLVAAFNTPIRVGPLFASDLTGQFSLGQPPQVPAPGAGYPFNDSQLAAEEAFSVYDHAPVWIFKKRADFNPAQAAAILNSVDISQVVVQSARDASQAPATLALPPERLAEQQAGGTWSEMFSYRAPQNAWQPLGVALWYLAVLALGLIALPLTATALPGLADRGYALSRIVALLVVSWLAWMAASLRLLPFTRGTLLLAVLVLALVSAGLFWRRRVELSSFLRAHWRHCLTVEAVSLGLFLFFLGVRLANPDLWHPYFGGERPMTFSFFNAVLKSTSFPPYNPWLAGYYINYYYYGFVVAGVLTKLLGIVPEFAFNLILPTWFSLTGLGAFGVAYNLVARGEKASHDPANNRGAAGTRRHPNEFAGAEPEPFIAVGADQAIVIGDDAHHDVPEPVAQPVPVEVRAEATQSDTAANNGSRTQAPGAPAQAAPVADEQSSAGGGPAPAIDTPTPPYAPTPTPGLRATSPARHPASPLLAGLIAALLVVVLGNLAQVYTVVQGFQREADHAMLAQSVFGDTPTSATLNGMWRVFSGQRQLAIATGTWYWDATRIVPALGGTNNEITEFPLFTFLYGDMHAHMFDLPFMLLALGWAASVLLAARRAAPGEGAARRAGWAESAGMWLVGGLALGAPRATNTWDFPLFMVLAAVAVIAAEWLAAPEPRLSRRFWLVLGLKLALLAGLALLLYRPFDQWFSGAYSEIERWTGPRMSVDAYLYVHGLFLFLLVSWLAWETREWLAETPATVVNHAGEWLPYVALLLLGLAVVVWALVAALKVPIGLVAVPLMLWAGLLLLRGDALPVARRGVLFLLGTALAVTVFVEIYAVGGDRMNTIFKFYMQVWLLLSVAAGAALAWVAAAVPAWRPGWRTGWIAGALLLFSAAALYTLSAVPAKMRDRWPPFAADDRACQPLPNMPLPYSRGLDVDQQPHSLYGYDFLKWTALCDRDAFLPLAVDHGLLRWLEENVPGSPVIAEAQSFDLYRSMGARFTWFTGLPDVVGWDWHTRQHNAAINTAFVTERGNEITAFFQTPSAELALDYIRRYAVRYIVVGPMEQAYYGPGGGLAKFEQMAAAGELTVVYQAPGAVIYQVVDQNP